MYYYHLCATVDGKITDVLVDCDTYKSDTAEIGGGPEIYFKGMPADAELVCRVDITGGDSLPDVIGAS